MKKKKNQLTTSKPIEFSSELIDPSLLKPHPRNYRIHPEDQLKHIIQSIKDHGFYRNIVVAKDGTILAGHGVVKAALSMALKQVPIRRLAIEPDSPNALKILAGDNEIAHLGEIDDRALSELLKNVMDADGLLGTDYDEMMLANLVFVSRPASEIADFNAAAAWVGMPGFENILDDRLRLIINFENEKDREQFIKKVDLKIDIRGGRIWSTRWPWTEREDKASVAFTRKPK